MLVESIGWIADVLFVSAYFLVSQGKVAGDGKLFNSMNLIGALLFGTYAIIKSAWPILVLEIFWGGIAIYTLLGAYSLLRKKPQTET